MGDRLADGFRVVRLVQPIQDDRERHGAGQVFAQGGFLDYSCGRVEKPLDCMDDTGDQTILGPEEQIPGLDEQHWEHLAEPAGELAHEAGLTDTGIVHQCDQSDGADPPLVVDAGSGGRLPKSV